MKYKTISGNGRTLHIAICERCETVLKHCGSVAQRYCPECKKVIDREKTRLRVRKFRESQKNLNT